MSNRQYNDDKVKSNNGKILLIGVVIAATVAMVFAYNAFFKRGELTATIVSVEPNYKAIRVANQDCHNVTTRKQVKNPDRTFWNGMFDSSKYPKYLTKETSNVVCHDVYSESEVLQYYTVEYKIKNATESMIVRSNPPEVNTIMTLPQLQSYMESSAITIDALDSKENTSQ